MISRDPCQAENLKFYRGLMQEKQSQAGEGIANEVAVLDVARAPGKVRNVQIRMDGLCPCFTTRNYSLWLEGFLEPKYKRYLAIDERYSIMGLPPKLADEFQSEQQALEAIGNSMAFDSTLVVLACLLQGVVL